MGKLIINGGRTIEGELQLQGAKNAVLPILAACILSGGVSVLDNCPDLYDVASAVEILHELGCTTEKEGKRLAVNSSCATDVTIPEELMSKMRSSIMFLGAILARNGRAVISYPGGCEIGLRPIDIHLKALKELGVQIQEEHGYIYCAGEHLTNAKIHLDFPSVGATENVMLLASKIKGQTIITNPALEPEIVDLQNFINLMGGQIRGAGTNEIKINGVERFHDVTYEVIPDRIAAATYLCAAAATGGQILLQHTIPGHLTAVTAVMKEMGCAVEEGADFIQLKAPKRLSSVNMIRTQVYPGFPTDAQAPVSACLAVADGSSVLVENIFENRFRHVDELKKMGADIDVNGRTAVIRGIEQLRGASVTAKDLRGGAALVIAALAAEGITQVHNTLLVDRGYEEIDTCLNQLGASVKRA